jgi:hypothetical protein
MNLPSENEQVTGISVTRSVLKRLKKAAQKRHPGVPQCRSFNALIDAWLEKDEQLEVVENIKVK